MPDPHPEGEREPGEGPWLFGEQFTLAGIMVGSMFYGSGAGAARPAAMKR